MCPLCYIPWIVTLLSIAGLGGVHLWVDANPALALVMVIAFCFSMGYGVARLWKYYKK